MSHMTIFRESTVFHFRYLCDRFEFEEAHTRQFHQETTVEFRKPRKYVLTVNHETLVLPWAFLSVFDQSGTRHRRIRVGVLDDSSDEEKTVFPAHMQIQEILPEASQETDFASRLSAYTRDHEDMLHKELDLAIQNLADSVFRILMEFETQLRG